MPTRPNREEAIAWNGFEMRSYQGVPPEGEISTKLQLELLHAYAACVSYVDAQIGRLLAEVGEDTIVILWSDHGWHLGEQSAWGKNDEFRNCDSGADDCRASPIETRANQSIG